MPSFSIEKGAPMPNSYQQITVANNAVATLTPPQSCNTAIITLETQGDIYWTDDGTTPVTPASGSVPGVGQRTYAGNQIPLDHRDAIKNFKAIAAQAASVTINVSYYHKN